MAITSGFSPFVLLKMRCFSAQMLTTLIDDPVDGIYLSLIVLI